MQLDFQLPNEELDEKKIERFNFDYQSERKVGEPTDDGDRCNESC